MALEIERKYVVCSDFQKEVVRSERMVQGYLSSVPGRTVRVRISGQKAFLTIKGPSSENGMTRYEFEQEIPLTDGEALLTLCEPGAIEKVRHWVKFGQHVWEVDLFLGANEGLVLAEIELSAEDEAFELPDWVGREVTGDRRYYNSMLTKHPFTEWNK